MVRAKMLSVAELSSTISLISLLLMTPVSAENPDHVRQLLATKSCPRCDLSGADLRNADLSGANLQGADLRNADLSGANLQGADLRNANIANTRFSNANTNGVLR